MSITPSPSKTERAGHTKGPWVWSETEEGDEIKCPYYSICEMSDGSEIMVQRGKFNKKNEKANARLITAAPDLLAAARLALDCAQSLTPEMTAAYQAMRAAIKKATQTP